jgi:hypothetical protein
VHAIMRGARALSHRLASLASSRFRLGPICGAGAGRHQGRSERAWRVRFQRTGAHDDRHEHMTLAEGWSGGGAVVIARLLIDYTAAGGLRVAGPAIRLPIRVSGSLRA